MVMSDDAFLKFHVPGSSPAVLQLRQQIEVINSGFNRDLLRVVLVTGESGAGKNHIARVIAGHRYWQDNGAHGGLDETDPLETFTTQFAEIALPTLPDSLIESELFGHRKGAFTGATRDRDGLLAGEAVDILLDEIGDASPLVQTKLLGVLETRRFRPLGGDVDDELTAEARFMLATHRDLGELVRDGDFREDLFWRANEFPIMVPPLRQQPENIPELITYQLAILGRRAMYDHDPKVGRPIPQLSKGDLDWAQSYAWPGNVRQLRHALVQWLAHGATAPLSRLAIASESRPRVASDGKQPDAVQQVRQRLEVALKTRRAAAPTVGRLIEEARMEIENEVVAWYDERSPSIKELQILFPEAKPTAVRSKLSQWRTR